MGEKGKKKPVNQKRKRKFNHGSEKREKRGGETQFDLQRKKKRRTKKKRRKL